MDRKIKTYGGYYEAFKETLMEKEQDKIDYCLMLLKNTGSNTGKIRQTYTGWIIRIEDRIYREYLSSVFYF
jgi:hypothetical protein